MKRFNRKPKTDPALARYPTAMAELLQLGVTDKEIDYTRLAEQLRDYIPELLRLVLDEDFADREQDDPIAMAPFHALEVLAILGPAEAAEPLLACLEWETDWIDNELARAYAGIGPVAIPLLLAYLADGTHDPHHRALASNALKEIADAHPSVREEIVDALTHFLDRPSADDSAEEERVTAFVISDLTDLHATSAYDAIARAFADDRVDTQILDLEFVEQKWGMRPRSDIDVLPPLRTESGVHLVLKCKVCGREREHIFPKVYCDIPTIRNEKQRKKYGPLIIPQRVICPKCGAVDQYELTPMAEFAIITTLLAEKMPDTASVLRPDQRVTMITFTTRWGKMHPVEAVERYQQELAKQPDNADLHVGYANLQRFLGYTEEAEERYHLALSLDSNNAEAWINLAQIAGDRRDRKNAIHYWEMVLQSTLQGGAPPDQRDDYQAAAESALMALRAGLFPEELPDEWPNEFIEDALELTASQHRKSAARKEEGRPVPEDRVKIGRNDPCPCGSGKKYKHCHGKK